LLKALPKVQVDPKELVVSLSKTDLIVEQQIATFIRKTGLSRRRFFYFREALGLKKTGQAKPAMVAASTKKKTAKPSAAVKKSPLKIVPAGATKKKTPRTEVKYVADLD